MRYAQLVVGPAGSGKSTYCAALCRHLEACRRRVDPVNMDPAAEIFDYSPAVDIRELINIDDVMETAELKLGPNGGLLYCMQFLLDNLDWLHEQLGDADDQYYIVDCPGQIELYTHLPAMRTLAAWLQSHDFRVCVVFLLDAQFVLDASKFFSGALAALSAIVNMEAPSVCLLTKTDLLDERSRERLDDMLECNAAAMLDSADGEMRPTWGKLKVLSSAIATVLDDYAMLKFLPLNITEEESVEEVLTAVDMALQYGEDVDVKVRYPEEADMDDDTRDNGLVAT